MNKLANILHDPAITYIDEEGNLNVDLMQIARQSGAPLTPQSISKISLMVQRLMRALNPDAECHVEVLNKIDRSFDMLQIHDLDLASIPKPRKRKPHA